jgi:hypothetical protein
LGKNISEPKEEQQNELFGVFMLVDVFPQRDHVAVLL